MSLSSALDSPWTGFRRWLDPLLPVGTWGVRTDWRRRLPLQVPVEAPPDLGRESGTVGRAIDARLRLAFTTTDPVADATVEGVITCRRMASTERTLRPATWWRAIAERGEEVVAAIDQTVTRLDLANRSTRFSRDCSDEEYIAKLLLVAAWYEVMFRAGTAGFDGTPIARQATAPRDLNEVLALMPPALVADVVALSTAAASSPLASLRDATPVADCLAAPTFDGSVAIGGADGDLLVSHALLEFKCTRDPRRLDLDAMWQLLGYTLLDYSDTHRITTVGIYHCRAAALIEWPLDHYLQLLGCPKNVADLRAECRQLCDRVNAYYVPFDATHQRQLDRAFGALGTPPRGACRGCGAPNTFGLGPTVRRRYCTDRCREEARLPARIALGHGQRYQRPAPYSLEPNSANPRPTGVSGPQRPASHQKRKRDAVEDITLGLDGVEHHLQLPRADITVLRAEFDTYIKAARRLTELGP